MVTTILAKAKEKGLGQTLPLIEEDIPLLIAYIKKKINAELHKNVIKVPIEVLDFLKLL